MPIIKPFKAVRYDKDKAGDLAKVIAPPYDVIPEKMQDELYERSPYNVVRLILNKITPQDTGDDNRYTRSKKFFDSLLDNGVLTRDRKDSLYIYAQIYKRGKNVIEEIGFIALMALDAGPKDKVLPHENTLAVPKADRLKLMRSVRANLSPIFILHDDSAVTRLLKKFRAGNKAIIDVGWEGVRHIVWKADDPKLIKAVQSRMGSKNTFIADGHHRYETAKNYAAEAGGNAKYMMVYFVEADEDMLTVLPTHRLIKDLGKTGKDGIINKLTPYFDIEKFRSLNKMMGRLGCLADCHAFGFYPGSGDFYVLKLKKIGASDKAIKDKPKEWKRLDVSILHFFVFQKVLGIRDVDENIDFSKDAGEAAEAVDSGKFGAAFFLNPTKVSQVKRIAKLGERMPRKATYFYPKPLSGLVINKF